MQPRSSNGLVKRGLAGIAVVCLTLALLHSSALAGVTTETQSYKGGGKRDGDSVLEFDAIRGPTRIVRIESFFFTGFDLKCDNGTSSETGDFPFARNIKVGANEHFKARQTSQIGDIVVTVRLKGDFGPTGRASGTLEATVQGSGVICSADWKARPKPAAGGRALDASASALFGAAHLNPRFQTLEVVLGKAVEVVELVDRGVRAQLFPAGEHARCLGRRDAEPTQLLEPD